MGLKLDYASSTTFKPHPPVSGRFLWHGPSISYEYMVNIAFDPAEPKPPTPKQNENWRVGIVQNVLFRSIRLLYANKKPISKSWGTPRLDAGSVDGKQALPFYAPPIPYQLNLKVEGISKSDVLWVFASADATFGPDGFHIKLPAGIKRSSESDSEVDLYFADQPQFDAPLHFSKTNEVLMERSDLITLQFWIIAMGKGTPVILAESDPFTIITWMRFSPNIERGKALDFAFPDWGAHAAKGVVKNLPENYDKGANWERFKEKTNQPVGLHRSSKKRPLLNGTLSNVEFRSWIQANDLMNPR
jgi:hypothetical protein